MSRPGLRDRWRDAVCASDEINDACRALLLRLRDEMTDLGHVCVPRAVMAAWFDVAPQRITIRLREAKAAGLLASCGGGVNGQTARYVAQIPGCRRTTPSTLPGSRSATPSTGG